jgi:DNA polymerase (family 10)
MAIHNWDVAKIFDRIADLLDIEGDNPFRIRSYRNAARTVGDLPHSIAEMVGKGEDLSRLPGIGKDLGEKSEEIVRTGRLKQLDELQKKTPVELIDLMGIGGLGPKGVRLLYKELGIKGIPDLEKAVRKGRLRELKGFGEKLEESILRDLEHRKEAGEKSCFPWIQMEEYAIPLLEYLKEMKAIDRITMAGSYRRKLETVGDLDVLATCRESSPVIDHFTAYDEVVQILSKGDTRSSVVLRAGIQADLRVVPGESYGAAMHYFTGSKVHAVALRARGVKRGLRINEYGVFRGEKRTAGTTEEADCRRPKSGGLSAISRVSDSSFIESRTPVFAGVNEATGVRKTPSSRKSDAACSCVDHGSAGTRIRRISSCPPQAQCGKTTSCTETATRKGQARGRPRTRTEVAVSVPWPVHRSFPPACRLRPGAPRRVS